MVYFADIKKQAFVSSPDYNSDPDAGDSDPAPSDDDLWFLPGPPDDGTDLLPPGPRAEPSELSISELWRRAEANLAARLARVAGRLGALDQRLRRGPNGWRHRLALMEAADLSWFTGDRITPDRLALWLALRLSGVQEDVDALAGVGWAVRRLTGGPGPEAGLAEFLDRHDPKALDHSAEHFTGRADGWQALMRSGQDLHPITRAGMGYHLWSLAGLGHQGDRLEAAVTAERIAASEGHGAILAPLAMGGARGPARSWRTGSATGAVASGDGCRHPERAAAP